MEAGGTVLRAGTVPCDLGCGCLTCVGPQSPPLGNGENLTVWSRCVRPVGFPGPRWAVRDMRSRYRALMSS